MIDFTRRLFLVLGLFATTTVMAQKLELTKVSTYETGVFDKSATEIVAYDKASKRVFFTNGNDGTIDILDVSTPETPTKISSIDLSTWGASANSVAVFNGIVAAAVEANDPQANGSIVLFKANNAEYIANYNVGAMPDMVTFSPDGMYILTACEGEPNDAYTVDPEGTVGIINISAGADQGVVSLVNFNSFDNQKQSLLNKGVRIFGPNASVSQDLEPEYITVLPDGKTAYVSLQENNAIAVIDIQSSEIIEMLGLTPIDHQKGLPSVTPYILNKLANKWPALGTPVFEGNKGTVMLGGFSGMWFAGDESDSKNHVFYVVPDRGPNGSTVAPDKAIAPYKIPNKKLRPFYLPNYQSRLIRLKLNIETQALAIDSILFTAKDGTTPISGRGNIATVDEVPVTYVSSAYPDTAYLDNDNGKEIAYAALPYDAFGGDFEGVIKDKEGNFWLCDEYRPAIFKFTPSGKLIERYVAKGTAALDTITGGRPIGYYGAETLPAVLLKRRANRGFEAIAYDSTKNIIYAFIQSPMDNPKSETRSKSSVTRIIGISATDGSTVAEYVYLFENGDSKKDLGKLADKIGDAVYIGDGKLLVIERDSDKDKSYGKKFIFEINLKGATNLRDGAALEAIADETDAANKTLEMHSADELIAAGIKPVYKRKVLNAASAGYVVSDKTEGIALLPDGTIAVINDNDFGLAGAGITNNEVLGYIKFDGKAGYDSSDKDNKIAIKQNPTFGLPMPDAIASYQVNNINYFVTANEGDTRDYGGYSEEKDFGDLMLDSIVFPNAKDLQDKSNMGRLLVSAANGDIDDDGYYDFAYSIGTRSFSIWDEYGNRVYDSGQDFETIIAENYPDMFNTSNDKNKFDNRSDNKGPEPEAVALAEIEGKTYAFIGLERMGGIMVYDITNPFHPIFNQYELNRNFTADIESSEAGDLGPEDIKYIKPEDSPRENMASDGLLLVASEVSGTITVYAIGEYKNTGVEQLNNKNYFTVYPNPVNNSNLFTSRYGKYSIYNNVGSLLKSFEGKSVTVSDITPGVYFIKSSKGETVKFIKQ